MRKVLEDICAEDTAQSIDIYWDGQPVTFWHNVELENELFFDIRGRVDYTYSYEEDTNSTRMTCVNVTIDSMSLDQYEDGELTDKAPHLNEVFVKKYLEQYLLQK
jgi:CRISPR/Cas system CSM-associated protein Csm5 (group 7 of RAMP superfamily)